jgi:hypothetical protein
LPFAERQRRQRRQSVHDGEYYFSVTAAQVVRGINHNKIETLFVDVADADILSKRRAALTA